MQVQGGVDVWDELTEVVDGGVVEGLEDGVGDGLEEEREVTVRV